MNNKQTNYSGYGPTQTRISPSNIQPNNKPNNLITNYLPDNSTNNSTTRDNSSDIMTSISARIDTNTDMTSPNNTTLSQKYSEYDDCNASIFPSLPHTRMMTPTVIYLLQGKHHINFIPYNRDKAIRGINNLNYNKKEVWLFTDHCGYVSAFKAYVLEAIDAKGYYFSITNPFQSFIYGDSNAFVAIDINSNHKESMIVSSVSCYKNNILRCYLLDSVNREKYDDDFTFTYKYKLSLFNKNISLVDYRKYKLVGDNYFYNNGDKVIETAIKPTNTTVYYYSDGNDNKPNYDLRVRPPEVSTNMTRLKQLEDAGNIIFLYFNKYFDINYEDYMKDLRLLLPNSVEDMMNDDTKITINNHCTVTWNKKYIKTTNNIINNEDCCVEARQLITGMKSHNINPFINILLEFNVKEHTIESLPLKYIGFDIINYNIEGKDIIGHIIVDRVDKH